MFRLHDDFRIACVSLSLSFLVLQAGGCGGGRNRVGNPDRIDRAEIEQYMRGGTPNLYELVERARPRWLRSRSERSFLLETQIVVYLNQQRLGPVEALRQLVLDNVTSLRWLDAAQAGLLPGASEQHTEGAIVVEIQNRLPGIEASRHAPR
ncbi:MAG: hypothetical protein L0271_16005 [Gemmatimonadetes bacterium]|nr:hypothetical protein [Gemmatimonadota bacterium]